MSIEIKQHLKLSQQLVMTPQLQQAIKLLQLSRMELCDMVRDEMLENPILEDAVESANEQAKAARCAGRDGRQRRRRRAGRRDRDADRRDSRRQGRHDRRGQGRRQLNEAVNDFDWEDYLDN